MRRTLRRRCTQHLLGWLARMVLRLLRIRSERPVAGPMGPALIAGNHVSWLDIVAALANWRCTFVAKKEVGEWPIIGWLARSLGVVFVDRTRNRDLLRAIPALESALREGELVLLFPEGTTTQGDGILRFRSALFEAAVRTGAPVHPLAIGGECTQRDVDNTPVICWLGEETLLANLRRLVAARGLSLTLSLGAPITAGVNRKALAARSREEVVRLFVPVRTHALVPTPANAPARAWSRGYVVTRTFKRLALALVGPFVAIVQMVSRSYTRLRRSGAAARTTPVLTTPSGTVPPGS